MYARVKTFLALVTLALSAPVLLLCAIWAGVRDLVFGPSFQVSKSKPGSARAKLRVLVTGGKMSKSSAVVRAVGREGHTVFSAEISPYELCHTRFSRYSTRHFVLPRPTEKPKEWLKCMQRIVKSEKIDLIIPCTAPIESSAYAHLRKSLPENVRVFALDAGTSDLLDNKFTFNQALVDAGIRCPETANMECLQDGLNFFKNKKPAPAGGAVKKFIVKPAVYDPVSRTEIIFLPIEDKTRQEEYLKSRHASPEVPYVIQEVLEAPEFGTFAVYNEGKLTAFEFFPSCSSCLRYQRGHEFIKYCQALELHRKLGEHLKLTGQITLDLMHDSDGNLLPIECNPRIHSAICTLEGSGNLGPAYADPDHSPKAPVMSQTNDPIKFWTLDQWMLRLGFWPQKDAFKLPLSALLLGRDALLHGDDPVPFLAMYLVQIPSLLLRELVSGTEWLKIDFCIGKIVKEGGD